MTLRTTLILTVVLTACQSQHRAYRIVCNAPIACQDCSTGSPEERQVKTDEYISQRLRNRKLKELFERMVIADPESSQQQLITAVGAAGVESCPFVDSTVIFELPELKIPESTE